MPTGVYKRKKYKKPMMVDVPQDKPNVQQIMEELDQAIQVLEMKINRIKTILEE